MEIVNLKSIGGGQPLSRAVISVGGTDYQDWETVSVRLTKHGNPLNTFRFTCSEDAPTPSWSGFRIKPGVKCTITMDGELAITGWVVTRQVFYNATQHVVEIQGHGDSGMLNGAAITKTGEFKKIDIMGLATSLAKPFGVNVKSQGAPSTKIDRASIAHGESAFEVIEKFARSVQAHMKEDPDGALVLMGALAAGGGATVIEGWNILEGREVIHSTAAAGSAAGKGGSSNGSDGGYTTIAQTAASDALKATEAYRRKDIQGGSSSGFSPGYFPKVVLSEIPGFIQQLVQGRTGMEKGFDSDVQIWVTVTLLGWQRNGYVPPSGGLWRAGDPVSVYSPMLIMTGGEDLTINAVTFTQDNNTGTRATLELVNKAAEASEGAGK